MARPIRTAPAVKPKFLTLPQVAWLSSALLAVWLIVQAKVSGVYPTVFQDEWIYSMHSRLLPLSESPIANYLYSWVYSSTNVCGLDFYACAKQLNVAFVVIFAFGIFLIAKKFLGFFAALAIAFLAAVSPISTYASFFMPESMYFAFSAIAIWLLLELRNRPNLLWAALAGATLGATALVKPHSIFLLPVIVVFLVVLSRPEGSTWASRLLRTGAYAVGFLAFKFGLGFALASSSGLVWFGTSYEATLNNILTTAKVDLSSLVSELPNQVVAGAQDFTVAAAAASGSLIELTLAQLSGHYLGLFALVGICLPALIATVLRSESRALKDLAWFILLSVVLFVPAFAAFSALAIRSGDPIQDRLIMRYYEFLLPLAFIVAIAGWKHVVDLGKIVRPIIVGATSVGLFIVGITGVGSYLPLIWDGAVLQGFASQRWLIGFVSISSSLILLLNLGKKEILTKVAFVGLVPFWVVASTFIATDSLRANALAPVAFDLAGQYARDNLTPEQQANLVVIGQVRNELEATKFWIDNPAVGQQVATAGTAVDTLSFPEGTEFVIAMNDIQISGNVSVIKAEPGWSLIRVD